MENNTASTQTTKKVFFSGSENLEPEQFMVFRDTYKDHLPYLKNFIKANIDKYVSIPTVRINKTGGYFKKVIKGSILKIEDDSFTIITNEDYSGPRDYDFELLIRFDSVLGIIPLHPEQSGINPLIVGTLELKDYFHTLSAMKALLEECIGNENCAITIFYRYTKENVNFHRGNYKVEFNEILEVNMSNLKYKHLMTTVQIPGQAKYHYSDMIERDEIDRYIAPDRYLSGVIVHFGSKHVFNFYLDDEES